MGQTVRKVTGESEALQNSRYRMPEGTLICETIRSGIRIAGYEGAASELHIPDRIDGLPVAAVRKKAFWGSRALAVIRLPDTVEEIGDWAFASCPALEEVKLPCGELRMGNKIFHGSRKLRRIFFDENHPALARLAAMAVTVLGAEYLLTAGRRGSRGWFQSLDAKLVETLHETEEDVLKGLVYCAEEDMLAKQERYLADREYEKSEAALVRLIYPDALSKSVMAELSDYLCRRTKGCPSEAAWEMIRQNRRDQISYCGKMIEIGAIGKHNIDAALVDLDSMQVELKTYLLKRRQRMTSMSEVWEALEL